MKKILFAAVVIMASTTMFAQRLDRLSTRPTTVAPTAPPTLVEKAAEAEGPDHFYLQAGGADKDGDVSPDAKLGLKHKDQAHPWFVVGAYQHAQGFAIAHRETVGATANYQLWTGKKHGNDDAPYLQLEGDYSNTFNSFEELTALLDGNVTRGKVSFDAIVGWASGRAKGSSRASDFAPALSLSYTVTSDFQLSGDYAFKNDVDGDASYDVGFAKALPKGNFTLIGVVARHNKFALRLRKDFGNFRLGGRRNSPI